MESLPRLREQVDRIVPPEGLLEHAMIEVRRQPQHRAMPRPTRLLVMSGLAAAALALAFVLQALPQPQVAARPVISSDVAVLRANDLRSAGWSPDGALFAVIEQGQGVGDVTLHVYASDGREVDRADGVVEAVWVGRGRLATLTIAPGDPEHGRAAILDVSTGKERVVQQQAARGLVGSPSGQLATPLASDGAPRFRLLGSDAVVEGIPLAWDQQGGTLAVAVATTAARRPGLPLPLALLDAATGHLVDSGERLGALWAAFDSREGVGACFVPDDQGECRFGRLVGGELSLTTIRDATAAQPGSDGRWLVRSGSDALALVSASDAITDLGRGQAAWSDSGVLAIAGTATGSADNRAVLLDIESGGAPAWAPSSGRLLYFKEVQLPIGRRVEVHLATVRQHRR